MSNIQSEETGLRLEYVFYFDKSDWNKYTREKTSYHSVYSVISYNFIAAETHVIIAPLLYSILIPCTCYLSITTYTCRSSTC